MSFYALAAAAAETAESGYASNVNHWVIGGVCLGILIVAMLILIGFGKGREHT